MPDQKPLQSYYSANPGAAWIALLFIAMSYILASISMSGTNVALPEMAREFSATAVLLGWIPTAFILANAVLVLPCGRLADRVGRKRVYLAGLIIFGFTHYLTTMAENLYWVIGLRVLQALGAAMVQACGMAIVMEIFSTERRGLAIGICASSVYFGMAAGPFIAGLLTHALGWRSVFSFQLPLTVVIALLIAATLKGEWRAEERRPFDWYGTCLLAVALSLIMMGVSSISDPLHLGLLALGVGVGTVFWRSQLNSEHPLLNLRAIGRNKTVRDALMALLGMYAASFPVTFILSMYLQLLLGMTPKETGTLLVIQAALMSVLAPVTGRLSDRITPQKLAATGSLFAALGYLCLCWLGLTASLVQVAIGLALVGVGMGFFSSPNQNAVYSAAPPDRLATVSAVLSLGRTMGNIIGMGVTLSLTALFVGPQGISASNFDDFLVTLRCVFLFSLLAAGLAAWMSVRHSREHCGANQVSSGADDGR